MGETPTATEKLGDRSGGGRHITGLEGGREYLFWPGEKTGHTLAAGDHQPTAGTDGCDGPLEAQFTDIYLRMPQLCCACPLEWREPEMLPVEF